MRLFVAAYPPADVCDHLERRLQDLHVAVAAGRGVNTRLARRDTWHVTLVFLGEVAEPRTADVHEAIERAVGGWRAGPGRLPWPGVAGADGGAGTQPPRSQAVVRAPGRVAAGTRPATVTERRQTGKA